MVRKKISIFDRKIVNPSFKKVANIRINMLRGRIKRLNKLQKQRLMRAKFLKVKQPTKSDFFRGTRQVLINDRKNLKSWKRARKKG